MKPISLIDTARKRGGGARRKRTISKQKQIKARNGGGERSPPFV